MNVNEAIFNQPFDVRAFVEVDKATLSVVAILYDVAGGKELASFSQSIGENEGEDFPGALHNLKEFCGAYPVWTFDDDQKVIEQNCAYFSIPFPFYAPFIRVKSLLKSWKINPRGYSSGTLHKAAGLEMDDDADDALHDVRSMAAAVSYFENERGIL